MGPTTQTPPRTVIGHSTTDKVVLFGGLPLAGLVLGFFLPRIADWATRQDWLPFQGPLKLIAGWDDWWVGVICIVIGLLAGVLLAAIALEDTLKVTVTGRQAVLAGHDTEPTGLGGVGGPPERAEEQEVAGSAARGRGQLSVPRPGR